MKRSGWKTSLEVLFFWLVPVGGMVFALVVVLDCLLRLMA